jgi:hypothetical protein
MQAGAVSVRGKSNAQQILHLTALEGRREVDHAIQGEERLIQRGQWKRTATAQIHHVVPQAVQAPNGNFV